MRITRRLIVRVHREALLALRAFWTILMSRRVTLRQLTDTVHQIDRATKAADRTYKCAHAIWWPALRSGALVPMPLMSWHVAHTRTCRMVMNPSFVNARIMRLYARCEAR